MSYFWNQILSYISSALRGKVYGAVDPLLISMCKDRGGLRPSEPRKGALESRSLHIEKGAQQPPILVRANSWLRLALKVMRVVFSSFSPLGNKVSHE